MNFTLGVARRKSPACRVKSDIGSCMFNLECTELGGKVLGTCVEGFFFKVCCQATEKTGNTTNASKDEETVQNTINDKNSTLNR